MSHDIKYLESLICPFKENFTKIFNLEGLNLNFYNKLISLLNQVDLELKLGFIDGVFNLFEVF